MADADTLSVAELDAAWQAVLAERQGCACQVCALPLALREYLDEKLLEFKAHANGGRGQIGLNTFAERVAKPKLNLSVHKLERHRESCLRVGCPVYPLTGDEPAGRPPDEPIDVGI